MRYSKEKPYQELGFELRRWYRKLRMFYKIYKTNVPNTFLNYYLNKPMLRLQQKSITFRLLRSDATFFLSFLLQSLDRTIKNCLNQICSCRLDTE